MQNSMTFQPRRLRPVEPHDLYGMAERLSEAARHRAYAVLQCQATHLDDDPTYVLARNRHERRHKALGRLTRALERRLYPRQPVVDQ